MTRDRETTEQRMANDRPYHNSELFSERFLDTNVSERSEWDCDDDATAAYDTLHELYENEYKDGYVKITTTKKRISISGSERFLTASDSTILAKPVSPGPPAP